MIDMVIEMERRGILRIWNLNQIKTYGSNVNVSRSVGEIEIEGTHDELLNEAQLEKKKLIILKWILLSVTLHVENVWQRCLPNAYNYPILEEYDFCNDTLKALKGARSIGDSLMSLAKVVSLQG